LPAALPVSSEPMAVASPCHRAAERSGMTFFRYVAIQVLAYGIDMGGFLLGLHSGLLGPLAANVVAKLAAGIFAFTVHRAFTFRTTDPADKMHQAVRYFILLGLNIPLSSGVLAVALRWITMPAFAKFTADVICLAL